MKASDRRELLGYMQRLEGLSKAAALSELRNCTELSLVKSLEAFRLQVAKQKVIQDQVVEAPVMPSEATVKPKKVPYTLLMLPEQLEGLKALSDEDGASVSHHIRQAVRQYLRTQSR